MGYFIRLDEDMKLKRGLQLDNDCSAKVETNHSFTYVKYQKGMESVISLSTSSIIVKSCLETEQNNLVIPRAKERNATGLSV